MGGGGRYGAKSACIDRSTVGAVIDLVEEPRAALEKRDCIEFVHF